MDQGLIDAVFGPEGKKPEGEQPKIRVVDEETGEIEYAGKGRGGRYRLKPIEQLFGEGLGVKSLDPQDRTFIPLLFDIEWQIANYYERNPDITDAKASLAMSRLSMKPEGDPQDDALFRHLQVHLRLFLSLNDFSRHHVKAAAKRVAKSVERHTKAAGIRGYLDFIRGILRRK